MKTWLKWIGYGTGGFFLLLLIGYFSLNWIVASAIEQSGTHATGVTTEVGDIQLAPFGGTFGMDGFTLANPDVEAFESERFFRLNRTDAAFALSGMLKSEVEIPEVTLQGLYLNVERKEGKENYQVILDRLNEIGDGEEDPGGQTYVIRELMVKDIRVRFHGYPGMSHKEIHLADMKLTDVGTGENGLNRSELIGIVIREAFRQMLTNPDMIPGAALEGIKTGVEGLGNLGEAGVEFLGNITDKTGNVLKDISGGIESVGESVKGLFGGGDSEDDE